MTMNPPPASVRKLAIYLVGTVMLFGVDLFYLHHLSYFQHNRMASVALDSGLFVVFMILAYLVMRLIKRREAIISESAERYKSLFDNHPDSIISFSLEGDILSSNHGLESLLGLGEESSKSASFLPMIHPPDLLKTLHHFQLAAEGMPQNFDAAFLHQKGFPIPSHVTFVPTKLGNQIVGVYAILKDLTEIREQKKEIDKLYKQNQLILNSVSEGIYGIDTNGRTIFWNKAAEAITGWKVDEMLGRRIHNLIRPVHSDGTICHTRGKLDSEYDTAA